MARTVPAQGADWRPTTSMTSARASPSVGRPCRVRLDQVEHDPDLRPRESQRGRRWHR
jgi:hypothetical protein